MLYGNVYQWLGNEVSSNQLTLLLRSSQNSVSLQKLQLFSDKNLIYQQKGICNLFQSIKQPIL